MIRIEGKTYKYIFGPVASRRLGVSLGIDLLPQKTCTLDCVYCECGKTTHLTTQRKEYVPTKDVIDELKRFLSDEPGLDYITFAGSGEPTLHSGISEIIEYIKKNHPRYKVALLTNGTLFPNEKVRKEVADADLIISSIDAGSLEIFNKVNRPHQKVNFEAYKEGLISLGKEIKGKLWLEFFIVPGLNNNPSELENVRDLILNIQTEKIQLNVLDRPGTESWVKQADKKMQSQVAEYLKKVESIPEFLSEHEGEMDAQDMKQRLLSVIKRRPCTIDDLTVSLGVDKKKVWQHICILLEQGVIEKNDMPRGTFYSM